MKHKMKHWSAMFHPLKRLIISEMKHKMKHET